MNRTIDVTRAIALLIALGSGLAACSAEATMGGDFVGPPAPGAEATPGTGTTLALESLGEAIREALSPEHLLGVGVRLLLLFLLLFGLERTTRALVRWRLAGGWRLRRWLPTARLTVGALAVLVVVTAFTPDQPSARALVILGVIVAVIWSGREALRNAAASAVIIARQAVRVGQHIRVADHAGRVASVSLRGVELERDDGSRVFVPGLTFHTTATIHAPGAGRAEPVSVAWPLSATARAERPERVRALARRLALLSPRRAPHTPVAIHLDDDRHRLVVELTPFDRAESDPLREEIAARLQAAWPDPQPDEST